MDELNWQLVPLTHGYFAKVDGEDYDMVKKYKWHVDFHGRAKYARTGMKVNGKKRMVRMHNLILNPAGRGLETDHINHDGLDNRRSNLRTCTHKQNMMNLRKYGEYSSAYRGVTKNRNRWRARSRISGGGRELGSFQTQEEAAIAYDDEVIKYGDKYAFLNFPERRPDVHR